MPIPLRPDFDALRVRRLARRSKDAAQTRHLLALAAIYEGASRTQAAVIGGVTLQIVRDWVLKFNAHGPDGLIDRKAPGPTPRLRAEFRVSVAKPTLSRELRSLGYRKLPARPRHYAQADGAVEDFKKVSPPGWKRLPARRALQLAT